MVTRLLRAGGDDAALDQLTPRVCLELHRVAAGCMRKERSGDTLQATALVHEVFLRLVEVERVSWQDRARCFAVSANMMRRLLVDRARARGASKRGDGAVRVPLEGALELAPDTADRDFAAIDDALQTLAKIDPRKEKEVELRFSADSASTKPPWS